MHKAIRAYLTARAQKRAAQQAEHRARGRAEKVHALPENIRCATADDLREGTIVWYKSCDDGHPHWKLVVEEHRHGDPFKAYTAHDGCRYGLDGAFVEVE